MFILFMKHVLWCTKIHVCGLCKDANVVVVVLVRSVNTIEFGDEDGRSKSFVQDVKYIFKRCTRIEVL